MAYLLKFRNNDHDPERDLREPGLFLLGLAMCCLLAGMVWEWVHDRRGKKSGIEQWESDDEMPFWCDECHGCGRVTTADYESYLGANYKPCPKCGGDPCIGEPPIS